MGIPSLFRWITNNFQDYSSIYYDYKNILENDKKCNNLYIDFNTIIHIIAKKDMNRDIETIINDIIKYLENIICYIDPQNIVYIAIDGVPPMAKIKHQRIRRFKTVKDKQDILSINTKYNYTPKTESTLYNYDYNMISNGTEFMDKLCYMIKEYIENTKSSYKCKLILSDIHERSEGEHKIKTHIINNPKNNDDVTIIYGLDADLIMLSLITYENNIYIMRENDSDVVNYVYLNINYMCEKILSLLNAHKKPINRTMLINDFVFITFLLGNDFIPNQESLKINENGIEILFNAYNNMQNSQDEHKYILYKSKEIDNYNFIKYISILSIKEQDNINFIDNKLHNFIDFFNSTLKERYIKTNNIEKLYEYAPYDIELSETETETTPLNKNVLCRTYLYALKWLVKYYFDECIDWRWMYDYEISPHLSELLEYMTIPENNDITLIKNDNELSIYEQLIVILPTSSWNLIPNHILNKLIANKDNIINYYPETCCLYIKGKKYRWECNVIIPKITEYLINYISHFLLDI